MKKAATAAVKSWKTTALGVSAFLTVASQSATALLDADPATMADWPAVIAAGIFMVGLIFSRDSDVTSEEAGAA